MASPERQELLRNAVVFLRDPKASYQTYSLACADLDEVAQTQSSPLAQRVQFLEAKGLTSVEIEEAMKQAASNQTSPYGASQQYAPYPPAYGPLPYAAQPPQPWDWRDYFVSTHRGYSLKAHCRLDYRCCLWYHHVRRGCAVQGMLQG